MSRRAGNRIRGPQSALTDFLAANNISAAQIRDDYERRLREAAQDNDNAGEGPSVTAEQDEAAAAEAVAAAEEAAENTRKRKRNEKDAIDKIKKSKGKKSKKKHDPDDEDEDGEYDPMDMYKKAKPLPGQFSNCEICDKRFTVTPYSKEGPDGGLLCTPCGKELAKDAKADKKAAAKKPVGRKRRQVESNRLDGIAPNRAKSLMQLCIEKAAQFHDDIEELGDMPQVLMERLSMIFSKKRVMTSKTMKLFVRPDVDNVAIHDAANLETTDFMSIFATAPTIRKIVLQNACQMKDEAMEYMMDKCQNLDYLQFYAANLVSHEMWRKVFRHYGKQLRALKLEWIDVTFEDADVEELVKSCPNLERVKFKVCRRVGEETINSLAKLKNLRHLSMQVSSTVSPESVTNLVQKIGSKLQTLSLEHFIDIDDNVIAAIHEHCTNLYKLRLTENDTATDAAYTALFTDWRNPPLTFVDLNANRDVDYSNPTGPEQAVGVASKAFRALMKHSGSALKHLDIASCRHIELGTFLDVFDGTTAYPALETINVSFCSVVDTRVVAGIFKSCPNLKKLIAFGCFDVLDVTVPRGIALIGVPKAQDEIEQIGVGVDLEEAIGRMVAVGAA